MTPRRIRATFAAAGNGRPHTPQSGFRAGDGCDPNQSAFDPRGPLSHVRAAGQADQILDLRATLRDTL